MENKMINIIASCCVTYNNKILFVEEKKTEISGLWDLPGGKVKNNEDIKQAAVREIREETGYDIELKDILLMQNYVNNKGMMLIVYFNAILKNVEQKEYRKKEINNVKWLSVDEIKNIPYSHIRGGKGIEKIIYNIENKISYPLNMIETYNDIK